MTVCACLLVKDEEDVIEYTVRHLLAQVDHVMVVDNLSTDSTREILKRVGGDVRKPGIGTLDVWDDEEPGYYQADKMTAFAQRAHAEGYDWFIPCDADEYWYSPFGRIADVIADLEEREPQALFLHARMLNHVVTSLDPPEEPNPFRRIGWRLIAENALPKVACRTGPALRIGMGNHEAWNVGAVHTARQVAVDGQLVIHHFPWRSEEQFCNFGDAPIWMADYSFKPIGDLAVGEEVIGYGRTPGRKKLSFVKSQIVAIHERRSPLVRVCFESGRSLVCTPDHLWRQHAYGSASLVPGARGRRRGDGRGWEDVRIYGGHGTYRTAKVGRTLSHVIEPSHPVTGRDEWLAGWLAGIYDGEGHGDTIAQSQSHNPETYARICAALAHFGFGFTNHPEHIQILGGRDAYVRFLNMIRPTRRAANRERYLFGGAVGGRISSPDKIVSIEPAGEGDVRGMTTTSGNYVAWGYASKNCRKITNGARAYAAAPGLDDSYGAHWRAFGLPEDDGFEERVRAWFREWGYREEHFDFDTDEPLVYDPAVVR